MQLANNSQPTEVLLGDKKIFTDDDLRELFQVSRRTTARWRETRVIAYLKAPGSAAIRYSRDQVAAFIRRMEQRAKGSKT